MFYSEFLRFKLYHITEDVVRRMIIFLDINNLHRVVQQTAENLAHTVIPSYVGLRNFSVFVSIGSVFSLNNWLNIEVVVSNFLKLIIKHPNDRMELHKNEFSTRF